MAVRAVQCTPEPTGVMLPSLDGTCQLSVMDEEGGPSGLSLQESYELPEV